MAGIGRGGHTPGVLDGDGGGLSRAAARRRRTYLVQVISVVIMLVVVGGGTFFVTERNRVTEVTLDDALEAFRQAQPAVPSTEESTAPPIDATPAADPSVEPTAPEDPSQGPESPAADPTDAPTAGTGVPAPVETATASQPRERTFALPMPGVYEYGTTGGEQISMGASHEYPSRTYGTVTLQGGCNWTIRHDLADEHVDERALCNDGTDHLQSSQTRIIEFFGQREGGPQTCAPPLLIHRWGEAPGAQHTTTCDDGKGTTSEVTRRFVGVETMDVRSTPVEVVHLVIDSVFSGNQQGEAHDEFWIHADTGLTIRWDRTVDSDASTSFGDIHYTEEVSMILLSLEPRT